jgi:Skp family chaperone for outer membrane proteins
LFEQNQKRKEEESEKLNKLILDYKNENERCTAKIQELKEKL